MLSRKIFFSSFIVITLLLLCSVSIFCWIVDPYGVFRDPAINSLYRNKPERFKHERLFKAIELTKIKPTIIFLGSSRAAVGLDPDYFEKGNNVYNLALPASNIYEQKRYLQHAFLTTKNIKKVLIGIDYFSFDDHYKTKPDFKEYRIGKTYIASMDIARLLLTKDAIVSSVKTVELNNMKPYFDSYYKGRETDQLLVEMRGSNTTEMEFCSQLSGFQRTYKKFKLSASRMQDFREIVDLCRLNGVELQVFISPAHALNWDLMSEEGIWNNFEKWKRDIVDVVPVWDFSGYNSVTTERISNKMTNYWDSSHYKKEVGNLILNRIYDKGSVTPADFGVFITRDNIAKHIESENNKRTVWKRENDKAIEFMNQCIK